MSLFMLSELSPKYSRIKSERSPDRRPKKSPIWVLRTHRIFRTVGQRPKYSRPNFGCSDGRIGDWE